MGERKQLLPGSQDFAEYQTEGYYYVDKTMMIATLLRRRTKVNLFTRPRRFGKSLNMSMLQNFFEIGTDPQLFDGLKIAQEKELCACRRNRFFPGSTMSM